MTTPQELQAKLNLGIEKARTNSRLLVLVGACIILLSLIMPWWGLTKYRMPSASPEVAEKMTEAEYKEHQAEVTSYIAGWAANQSLNKDFYVATLGTDYESRLTNLAVVSGSSGTISLYGGSTWTGWFGILSLIAGAAWYVAPKANPDFEEHAWTIPWLWTALGAVFLIFVLAFYFTVPDVNGVGYSQGLSLGIYIAIAGALCVVVGGTFLGIKSANDRLAHLAAQAEEESADGDDAGDEAPAAAKPAPRRPVAKAPPPVDPRDVEAEAKRKRLTDW